MNATATLVELNSRRLAITNYHILQAYEKILAEDGNTVFQIGGCVVDPLERCWDAEDTTDLLVLDVSDLKLIRESRKNEMPALEFLSLQYGQRRRHSKAAMLSSPASPRSIGKTKATERYLCRLGAS